jgi:hypothetical protein
MYGHGLSSAMESLFGIVSQADDKGASDGNDVVQQFIFGVSGIDEIDCTRGEHRPEYLFFVAVSVGNDVCGGSVVEDVHFQVQFGVKDLRFGQRSQACFLDSKTFLDIFQCGRLLDSPKTGEDGCKEIMVFPERVLPV